MITYSYSITRQPKTITSPLSHCLWPPNLAGWWLTLKGPTLKVTWIFHHVELQDQIKNYTAIIMATKLSRVETCNEQLHSQCPWPPNLIGWWLTLKLSGLAKSCDKLKPIYLHYQISLLPLNLLKWWLNMTGCSSP